MDTIRFYGASWCTACPGQWAIWSTHCEDLGFAIEYIDIDKETKRAMADDVTSLPTVIVGKNRYQSLSRDTIVKIVRAIKATKEQEDA